MKNKVEFLLKSKLNINVKGPNIERFIRRLKNNNIEILNLIYISKDEINLKIYKLDYDKVIKIKTIYIVDIIDYYGIVKYKNSILSNKFIILFVFLALISLYITTNIIFDIEVVTNDSKMKTIILNELEELGIKKYKFKKNYMDIKKIKSTILNNYKNEIEWIEIENIGTKYIIKYEPRVINKTDNITPIRNIIASKDAVITNMYVSKGQIIKNVNSYVKKGSVIVSGYIKFNDSVKDIVSSEGTIYGETWYNVTITYPFKYEERIETGNKKRVLVIRFINKEIEIFNFNKYKAKNIKDKIILKNNLLPVYISNQQQKEVNIINEDNTEEEVIDKAISISKKKIEAGLEKGEYIKNYKVLDKRKYDDSMTLNVFFSVIENITDYEEIIKEEENIIE